MAKGIFQTKIRVYTDVIAYFKNESVEFPRLELARDFASKMNQQLVVVSNGQHIISVFNNGIDILNTSNASATKPADDTMGNTAKKSK